MDRIKNTFGNLLVFFAGMLLTLSFAPFYYSFLAIFALTVLFYGWTAISPGKAALRGLLFGVGFFGTGASWIYNSLHDFSGAGVVAAGMLTLLFVLILASFVALAGYFCGKFLRTANVAAITLGYPAAWVFAEYLRGYVTLNGFPWLQAGYSQEQSFLAGYIPLFGIYGTGFLVAWSAAVIAFALQRKKSAFWLGLGVVAIWGGGAMLRNVVWTHPIGAPIRVTLVQGNIPQNNKWLPENRDKTLRMYWDMSAQHWDSQLIVWPETAVPAFYDLVKDSFIFPLYREAQKHRTDIVVPLPVRDENSGDYYNAVMTLGSEVGIYRKVHLVPFGEYLPLQPLSGAIAKALQAHIGDFVPGRVDQPLLKAAGYPFATSICYEDAFGVETIRALPEAAYLVNVTNDSWFGDYLQPQQHMQMARMRALETGRYMLRATNTGITAVVAPDGSTVAQAPPSQRYALNASIVPMGGMTPYALLGDKFTIAGLLLILAGIPLLQRLRKQKALAPERNAA
ncbi:MAG: apolipoprotein N-acyltransferase [Gammaproteobacteria bacterium]